MLLQKADTSGGENGLITAAGIPFRALVGYAEDVKGFFSLRQAHGHFIIDTFSQ